MTDDAQRELLSIYESFPGIVTPTSDVRGSHLHLPVEGADDDGVVAVMSFERNSDGRAAELVVDFIMSRVGLRRTPASHAAVPPTGRSSTSAGKDGLARALY